MSREILIITYNYFMSKITAPKKNRNRNPLQDIERDKIIFQTIENILTAKGVSKYRMCKDTGIAQAKLNTFSQGKSNLTKDEFILICKYLGIANPNSLYYNKDITYVVDEELNHVKSELKKVSDKLEKYERAVKILNE